MADTTNNWSNIDENEYIVHSEIDEVINDFDNIQMINNVSSDISNDDNQDCTDCTVLSKFNKHEAFQKIDELREILKGHADMNIFQDQLSIF